jgi:protein O-GlcNAc transferase
MRTMKKIFDMFTKAAHAHQAGQFDEARRGYEAIIKVTPGHIGTLGNLGSLLRSTGQLDAAIAHLEKAAVRYPAATEISFNLANAYHSAGRLPDAIATYRQLLSHAPNHALAYYSIGKCFQDLGNNAQAADAYRSSLAHDPNYYDTYLNLAAVLQSAGELYEGISVLKRAAALDPARAPAWNNLGMAEQEVGRFTESIEAYKRAFALEPTHRIASNILMGLQYHPGISDADLLNTARGYGARFSTAAMSAPKRLAGKLRLGFVSADLYAHPVGFFLRAVTAKLVERGVDCTFYSSGTRRDHVTAQLATGTRWRHIQIGNDEAVAAQIRKDGIDVLIDLSGHSSQNRLPVFALRPAPLQLSWMGYFATTGMLQIDAVLMDPWHAPEGSAAHFTERVIRLPHSRFCYSPPEFAPAVAAPPVLTRGQITFGSFNNTAKINDQVIALWTKVLQAVPDSRLLLKWRALADTGFAADMHRRFAKHGMPADRIEMRGQSVHIELLAQYADVDIALDPFPFSGGQTSCEALWMGVPVVTLPGARPVSRQTLCFLANINRLEWVADTADRYVEIAAGLARDVPELIGVRASLREQMASSPLCDASRFADHFIKAIEQLASDCVNQGR